MHKNRNIYIPLAFANFLSAFGGGLILSQGIHAIHYQYLQGGSILALFLGTALGLLFLEIIPKKSSERITKHFSFFGGLTSLLLFIIFKQFSVNNAIYGLSALCFFILLSIRFGFWFFARVKRIDRVSDKSRTIAFVALGFYIGIILGLIVWLPLQLNNAMLIALFIDAVLQFSAGIIDIFVKNKKCQTVNAITNKDNILNNRKKEQHLVTSLIFSISFLTIGIQTIQFALTNIIIQKLSVLLVAAFYLGIAISASICSKVNIHLTFDESHGRPEIWFTIFNKSFGMNLIAINLIAGFFTILAVLIAHQLSSITHYALMLKISFYLFIFIGAFLFETVGIAIFSKIGKQQILLGNPNIVMKAYGYMGITAVLSLWLVGLMNNHLILLITLIITTTPLSYLSLRLHTLKCSAENSR